MVVSYVLLLAWAFVVLFPLYWLAITSLKTPLDVNGGPFYVPFRDFQPNLDNWRYIFVDLGEDTFRPYLNTVVVGLTSTTITVLLGAMAAYGLVRMRYRVSLGRELARLVIHGALHLTGLDHRTRPQRVRMRALESARLQKHYVVPVDGTGLLVFHHWTFASADKHMSIPRRK